MLRLPAKRITWLSVVSVNTTLVPVVTALLKVAPLLLVRAKVLKGTELPIAPVTSTVPAVPALSVTACKLLPVPFRVLANVMLAPVANAPLLVVSKVVWVVTTASSAM